MRQASLNYPASKAPHSLDDAALSVVIPCFNEAPVLAALISDLDVALPPLGIEYEVIIVNDGSTDASFQILETSAQRHPWLRVVHFRRKAGQTAAMMAGFEVAQGSVVVTMDADRQNDPADIPKLLEKLDEGFDVVSGWRIHRRDDRIKRILLSRVANWVISFSTGVSLHDYGCTLKAYRREVLEDVRLYGEMHRFIPVYVSWNGAKITELAVNHHPRTAGVSNYGMSRIVKVTLDLFVLLFLHRYAQKPIYVFGSCALISFAISGGAGLAMLYYKYFGGKTFIETPLPILWATTCFTGVLCLLLGLVAEVCMRIYHESQGKSTYRISSVANLPSPAPGRKGEAHRIQPAFPCAE